MALRLVGHNRSLDITFQRILHSFCSNGHEIVHKPPNGIISIDKEIEFFRDTTICFLLRISIDLHPALTGFSIFRQDIRKTVWCFFAIYAEGNARSHCDVFLLVIPHGGNLNVHFCSRSLLLIKFVGGLFIPQKKVTIHHNPRTTSILISPSCIIPTMQSVTGMNGNTYEIIAIGVSKILHQRQTACAVWTPHTGKVFYHDAAVRHFRHGKSWQRSKVDGGTIGFTIYFCNRNL